MTTYHNWTREISEATTKDDLSGVMARYCDSVGFAFSPSYGYKHYKLVAEQLKRYGIAQRFAEAAHKERFLP